MSFTAKEMSDMQSQAQRVLDNRPSVFRIGFIVLLLRFISSLLSIVFYLAGIMLMFDLIPEGINLYILFNGIEIPHLWLGIGLIGFGLLLNTITRLCRGMRNRNWYILHSYDVLEWASKLPLEQEDTDPIP